MNKNFWQQFKKPIICLAPMADITDAAFREIVAKYGKPDVMWTEFVSCDGLCSVGKKNILIDLKYSKKERPIVAQVFGNKPENFTKTAELVKKLGFDGIDINMGCPVKPIEKQGAGASLMKNPELAKEIILATKKGADGIPVSVKTRLGYNKVEIDTWIKIILETKPAALSVHWRTRKEMSKEPAHWEEAKKIIKLRDKYSPETLIIGNGDVANLEQAKKLIKKYKVDGAMIGRGAIGNPWVFNHKQKNIPLEDRIKVMLEHAKLYEKYYKNKKSFLIMRKHMNAYIKGFDNIKSLRIELMKVKDYKEAERVVGEYFTK